MKPKQEELLIALTRYKFLNRKQIAKLGIEKYNSNISDFIKPLVEKRQIGVMDAKPYGLGYVYYLRKPGAKAICEHSPTSLAEANYCQSEPTLTSQTLYHRTFAIDFQLELYLQAIDYRVLKYIREIEPVNKLERATRISAGSSFLEPDAIFKLETEKGVKLFCFELEHKDYTKKSIAKISKHIDALNMKSASIKMYHDKGYRVLMVYTNPGTMKSVMKNISRLQDTGNWVLFRSYEDIVEGIKQYRNNFIFGKIIPNTNDKTVRNPVHRLVNYNVDELQSPAGITKNWQNAKGEYVDLF